MSFVSRRRGFGERFQPILCIISFLFVREVNTVSGEDDSSGDDEPFPDDVGNLDTVDDDVLHSRLVLCVILFIVTLGPVLTYFCTFSYSSQNGFLRITSLFYSVLFWVAVTFAIGCSATHCNHHSKALYIIHLLALIFMPFFWLIILIESWISRERELITKLDKTKPIVNYIQDLKNAPPKITWEVECYHFETITKMVPYMDSNGDTIFREECFKEKITTHTESQVSWSQLIRDVNGENVYSASVWTN